MDLRQAAEAERILEIPRRPVVPEVAALEERADVLERHAETRVGPCRRDGRVECVGIGPERLQVERACDVEGVQEGCGVSEGESGVTSRHGVVAEQREPLAARER